MSTFLTSCGSEPEGLNAEIAQASVQAVPQELSSEAVEISTAALTCAIEQGLWIAPVQGANRSVARLTELGRSLHFSDDVSIGDADFHGPYTQIRGTFPLQVTQVVKISNGANASTKIVTAKVSAVISQACFAAPLPIFGVRQGRISSDSPVTLQFAQYEDESWHFEKIVH